MISEGLQVDENNTLMSVKVVRFRIIDPSMVGSLQDLGRSLYEVVRNLKLKILEISCNN